MPPAIRDALVRARLAVAATLAHTAGDGDPAAPGGGRTNCEIAQQLNVSASTVKNHVQHIVARLDASDRTQAAVKAAGIGLIDERD